MRAFVVADSHARAFRHMAAARGLPIEIVPRSAVTMFRVGRDGVADLLRADHDRSCPQLDSPFSPGHGDVLVAGFGYVDVLNNLVRRRNTDAEIAAMVAAYLGALERFASDRRLRAVLVDTQLVPQTADSAHACSGSLAERVAAGARLRSVLEAAIAARGPREPATIRAWGFGDQLRAADGGLDRRLAQSEDNAHVGHGSHGAIRCARGCDVCTGPAAQIGWDALARALADLLQHDALVVGKADLAPPPDGLQHLFGVVSFANCPRALGDHTHPRFQCVSGEAAQLPDFARRHRGGRTYTPARVTRGRALDRNRSRAPPNDIWPVVQREQRLAVPELDGELVGWLSTGAAAILFWAATVPEGAWVYVHGFSHLAPGAAPGDPPAAALPPRGMPRADRSGKLGRHQPEVERDAVRAALETGRLALLETPPSLARDNAPLSAEQELVVALGEAELINLGRPRAPVAPTAPRPVAVPARARPAPQQPQRQPQPQPTAPPGHSPKPPAPPGHSPKPPARPVAAPTAPRPERREACARPRPASEASGAAREQAPGPVRRPMSLRARSNTAT